MKKETYLHIPQPCHEDWNQMTPETKGRHCTSCAKTVVDFTLMSDTQVLNYLLQSKTNVCGRFAADQLQRPLQPILPAKKKSLWYALLMPLLVFFSKAGAQTSAIKKHPAKASICTTDRQHITGDTIYTNSPVLMGKVALPVKNADENKIIKGRVVDDKGKKIPYASVLVKGKNINTVTDTAGYFEVEIDEAEGGILSVYTVGYETKEMMVHGQGEVLTICLTPIQSQPEQTITAGMVVAVKQPKKQIAKEEQKHTAKVTGYNHIAFFPNPAFRGSNINIVLPVGGAYHLQMLDAQSKLVASRSFAGSLSQTHFSFSVPSAISPGLYFITIAEVKSKKQYDFKIEIL